MKTIECRIDFSKALKKVAIKFFRNEDKDREEENCFSIAFDGYGDTLSPYYPFIGKGDTYLMNAEPDAEVFLRELADFLGYDLVKREP